MRQGHDEERKEEKIIYNEEMQDFLDFLDALMELKVRFHVFDSNFVNFLINVVGHFLPIDADREELDEMLEDI